jgi:hypothetical protein
MGQLYRVLAPHFTAGFVADGARVIAAAPILGWCRARGLAEVLSYFMQKRWNVEKVEEVAMVCLVCGSENLKAHVELVYDVPLAARKGGIKIGGIKVTQLDLRVAWEKLAARPIFCHECGQEHVYNVGDKEPLQIKDGP